ncbi:MAG: hypothetical protein IPN90_12475 [Elusimicrobia bacterium]|nr:hypothetical protein [Elusimicrobiota bacterium]
MSVVYDICLSNRDLREALERVLRQYKMADLGGKFVGLGGPAVEKSGVFDNCSIMFILARTNFLATVTRP